MPYISASIIIQLLAATWAPLQQLKKEGEHGPSQDHTIYPVRNSRSLATVQAYGLAVSMEAGDLVTDPGWFFRISTVITLGRRHDVPDVAR